jgi:hypothetical protein
MMFQQTWTIEVVVSGTIRHLATNSGTRKRAIVCVLPTHFEWREVPVVTTGDSGAVGVCFLVAAGAIQASDSFAFRSTNNVCDVTVPVVALLWIVGGGVTVNTTRGN